MFTSPKTNFLAVATKIFPGPVMTSTFGMLCIVKKYFPAYLPSSYMSLLVSYSGVIIGSVLPDIDEENSYIGNRFKLFSIVISSLIKHRGITH